MKKLIIILCVSFFLTSCEDVIDIDLNSAEPRLVIDASIDWVKGTAGNEQSIILSLSAPYFSDNIEPANNAQVSITDGNSNTYVFIEEANTGIYRNSNFIPEIDQTYTLEILYNGESYTGTETLKSVPEIEFVEQNDDVGFTGDETELKAYYTDPIELGNHYFFQFTTPNSQIPDLDVYEDRFTNGNQIFGYYASEDIEPGDEVIIRNHGVSEQFYQFMFVLLQQNSEDGGGPFETQPATVRGNCVNTTNADNFPFGYFRLSEVDEVTYTIE